MSLPDCSFLHSVAVHLTHYSLANFSTTTYQATIGSHNRRSVTFRDTLDAEQIPLGSDDVLSPWPRLFQDPLACHPPSSHPCLFLCLPPSAPVSQRSVCTLSAHSLSIPLHILSRRHFAFFLNSATPLSIESAPLCLHTLSLCTLSLDKAGSFLHGGGSHFVVWCADVCRGDMRVLLWRYNAQARTFLSASHGGKLHLGGLWAFTWAPWKMHGESLMEKIDTCNYGSRGLKCIVF